MPNNFGEILRALRKERGLTAVQLSKMINISQSKISKIETGKYKKIDPDLVQKIYRMFNVSADQILGLKDRDDSCYTKVINLPQKKAEDLKNALAYAREEFSKLTLQDERVSEIIDVLDSFSIELNPDGNNVSIICHRGFIHGGWLTESQTSYALVLMSFFSELCYKAKRVVKKIQKTEYSIAINALTSYLGRVFREQALYNVKADFDFKAKEFNKEFKMFIEEAIATLSFESESTDDMLKEIRGIYETIIFENGKIKYYDFVSKVVKDVDINNAVEIQYMFMNLYSQAYAETRMLENNHEYEDIYGIVLQQIIMMRVLIPKYFLAQKKGSI
jgi:transcriptional regulator with XRE-family HTH domain